MPEPQDRYRVPYAILQGLKAGMQELQRGREEEEKDIMIKMMMGTPLTLKEQKRRDKMGYGELPRGITEIGKMEKEQRRHEAEVEKEEEAIRKAEEVREKVQSWNEKKETQRIKEKERKLRVQIHLDAIDAATPSVEGVKIGSPDMTQVPKIEAEMLENAGMSIPGSLQAKRLGVYEEYKKARYGHFLPKPTPKQPAKKKSSWGKTAVEELRKVLPKFKKKPVRELSTDELLKLQSELGRR